MNSLEIVSVPVITTVVTTVIALVRHAIKKTDDFDRFIPLICALLGVVMGLAIFYTIPKLIPAENLLEAIFIGGASGLSATGVHQIFVQAKTYRQEKKNKKDAEEKEKIEVTDTNSQIKEESSEPNDVSDK